MDLTKNSFLHVNGRCMCEKGINLDKQFLKSEFLRFPIIICSPIFEILELHLVSFFNVVNELYQARIFRFIQEDQRWRMREEGCDDELESERLEGSILQLDQH